MLAALLALIVQAAAPTLWLRVDVEPDSPCKIESLAAAIRVQRPDALLSVGTPPAASDLRADLVEASGTLTLTVRGQGKPLTRVLPPAGATCEEALQTAALMIDRYLDELHAGGEEASIDSLEPAPGPGLRVELGPSVVQGPFGLSGGLILELDLNLGLLLLSIGGEANLAQSKAIGAEVPGGTYSANPAATWLALGVAPRLGPGRLFAQASLGLSLLWIDARSPSGFFASQQGFSADPYAGVCAGYMLDLSEKFGLAARYEERWVPSPTSFAVEGTSSTVSVRPFSGDLALLASYAFF